MPETFFKTQKQHLTGVLLVAVALVRRRPGHVSNWDPYTCVPYNMYMYVYVCIYIYIYIYIYVVCGHVSNCDACTCVAYIIYIYSLQYIHVPGNVSN